MKKAMISACPNNLDTAADRSHLRSGRIATVSLGDFKSSLFNLQFLIRLLLMTALLGFCYSARGAEPPREYQVKAVFLFNFAQFTEWPSNAFASADSPIVIGTLGNNPFRDFLRETVSAEILRGRKLVVEHYQKVEEIKK